MPCSARPVSGLPAARALLLPVTSRFVHQQDLCRAGELVAKQHCDTVRAVFSVATTYGSRTPFQSNELLSNALRRCRRLDIDPSSGASGPGNRRQSRCTPSTLFNPAFLCQFLVTLHHVANAHGHQQALFQHCTALFFISLILVCVLILAITEMFIRPCQGNFSSASS